VLRAFLRTIAVSSLYISQNGEPGRTAIRGRGKEEMNPPFLLYRYFISANACIFLILRAGPKTRLSLRIIENTKGVMNQQEISGAKGHRVACWEK